MLRSIQTQAEWRKVLCRMTPDGAHFAKDEELAVIKRQEQQLMDFLQEGFNRNMDFHEAKAKAHAELFAVYNRLNTEIAWGYALAMNDDVYYDLFRMPNPHYPRSCIFGPCNDNSEHLA
ncbi:hypothetical protein D3C76_1466470 [compost metagenome]